MSAIYKAIEVSAPGDLRVVERQIVEPGPGQVRIRVEACGICHTDAYTVTGTYPGLTLPRVPGHEVIGRIDALGPGASRWKIGQRVGVGLIAGEDGICEPCRRGDALNCLNPAVSGVSMDGGYAEMMIAEARGIASIPDELSEAAFGGFPAEGPLASLGRAYVDAFDPVKLVPSAENWIRVIKEDFRLPLSFTMERLKPDHNGWSMPTLFARPDRLTRAQFCREFTSVPSPEMYSKTMRGFPGKSCRAMATVRS